MSGPVEKNPSPRKGLGSLLVGNPFQDESVAFKWLILMLAAAVTVALVAKLISPAAAVVWGILILIAVAIVGVRVVIYLLGSPDDDDPEE